MIGDDGLLAIDHQHTFTWYLSIPRQGPSWRPEMATRAHHDHFLRTLFAAAETGASNPTRQRLVELSAAELAALTDDLPPSWLSDGGAECVADVRVFLADVQNKATEVFDAIENGRAHA